MLNMGQDTQVYVIIVPNMAVLQLKEQIKVRGKVRYGNLWWDIAWLGVAWCVEVRSEVGFDMAGSGEL